LDFSFVFLELNLSREALCVAKANYTGGTAAQKGKEIETKRVEVFVNYMVE